MSYGNDNGLAGFDTQLSLPYSEAYSSKFDQDPSYNSYQDTTGYYPTAANNIANYSTPRYASSNYISVVKGSDTQQTSFNNYGYRGNSAYIVNYQNRHNIYNSNYQSPLQTEQSNGGSWKKTNPKQDNWNINFYGSQPDQQNSFGAPRYNSLQFADKKYSSQITSQQSNTTFDSGMNSSNYSSYKKFKQHFATKSKGTTLDNTPAPTLFMGRDDSYPSELNELMKPFLCSVCNSKLNSIKSANIHYESKAHGKQVLGWIKKTYTDKGLPAPEIKLYSSDETTTQYRCDLCKVDLTSVQHALQHNNGKKHKQAAAKISTPTGIGYYDVEGKWVETGKIIDKQTGKESPYIMVSTPSGSEPVVLHVASSSEGGIKRPAEPNTKSSEQQPPKRANLEETQNDKDVTKESEHKHSVPPESEKKTLPPAVQEAFNTLECKICTITTTSCDQMVLHLKGARHTKKLRAMGEPPVAHLFEKMSSTILDSLYNNNPFDISNYRTPSGSYYCKTCDVGLEDVARIKKHICSKAHSANVRKEDRTSS